MNLRRDWPTSASDVQRLHDRYALSLAVLGLVASAVRLARVVTAR